MEYKARIAVDLRVTADDQTDAERKARLVALRLTEVLGILRLPDFVIPEFSVEVVSVEEG